jgi:hypothetical protein
MDCAKFWMGHTVDPYNYVKFMDLEPEYMLKNAKIAAKYLNIISGGAAMTEGPMTMERLLKIVDDNRTLLTQALALDGKRERETPEAPRY